MWAWPNGDMAELAPPQTPGGRPTLTPEQAARIDRLARRGGSVPTGAATGRTGHHDGRPGRALPGRDGALPSSRERHRRKHPARGARLAALGLSLASTAGLAALFASIAPLSTAAAPAVVVSGTTSRSTSLAAAPERPVVVDGGIFRTKWGPVQVEAVFDPAGRLTDVTALQTPDDRRRSVDINDRAVPRLTSAALGSQSASVDTVSGATYTSDGYRRSLQSAIDAARDAGLTAIA